MNKDAPGYPARARDIRLLRESAALVTEADQPNSGSPRVRLPGPDSASPLRGELLSLDRLEQTARDLGAGQLVSFTPQTRPTPLLGVLDRAESQTHSAVQSLAADVRAKRAISPSTEWLLDNSYLVDEQVREVRENLPNEFGKELPYLTSGPYERYPRVYELAVALAVHTDSRLEEDYLEHFVAAYQETSPLTMGELWAVPIMLRAALVENVRRLARRVVATQADEIAADDWADALLTAAEGGDPRTLMPLLDRLKSERADCSAGFLVRLELRLQGQDIAIVPVHEWVRECLRRIGDETLETCATDETRAQAADQVSIANAITSMRFLTALDWKTFFEAQSVVERILQADPTGTYAGMDFATRDRYRHAVEELARRSPHSEPETARAAVAIADHALNTDPTGLAAGHVGHYLVGHGRLALEEELDYRPRLHEALHRGILRSAGPWYFGGFALLTILLEAIVIGHMLYSNTVAWAVAVVGAVALIPLSEVALAIVNRMVTAAWPPKPMPKMDYMTPLAEEDRTLVVVPALLVSPADTERLIDSMEVNYLANTDPNIHFALLGDLKAAPSAEQPADDDILDTAQYAVRLLNERYGVAGAGPFHMLVRERVWDAGEGVWMGHERKRGALEDLVGLLAGDTDGGFRVRTGDASFLTGVTFALTLDSDTVLPRDAARELASTIAHPLNRARVDEKRRVVSFGHGLIQPMIANSLPAAGRSRFARLFSGVTGVDPYGGTSSDVYQDAFGEGSYTGKGIFEVGVYHAVLTDRFPDDTLLSHDLVEGSYLRTGYASDIEVFDDHPATYPADAARFHRWIRGDWQAAPWMLPTVPTKDGRERNPLRPLSRWKIFDNLRRSLYPLSMVLFFALGLALVPNGGLQWPVGLLLIVFSPAYLHLFDSLLMHPRGVTLRSSLKTLWSDFARDTSHAFFALITLPHAAWANVDAIARALWRAHVSHTRRLEWTTAAEAESTYASGSMADYVRRMGTAQVTGAVLLAPSLVLAPVYVPVAVALAVVWLSAPAYVRWMSSALRRGAPAPTDEQRAFVRRMARKTWRFFDTFVTAEDRWLAPDNFQEDPKGALAHRTSPTNIGLQLVAYLAAHDLGYVSLSDLVERVTRTLQTMAGMERFRGHFFNWYDTRTLEPLPPGYVSTVDSGNLAGYLLVLRVGLLESSEAPVVSTTTLDGIADTVRLALEDLDAQHEALGSPLTFSRLRRTLEEVLRRSTLPEPPHNSAGWRAVLDELSRLADVIVVERDCMPDMMDLPTAAAAACRSLDEVVALIHSSLDDMERYLPWAPLVDLAPYLLRQHPYAEALIPILDFVPSLVGLAEGLVEVRTTLDALARDPVGDDAEVRAEVATWARHMRDGLEHGRPAAAELLATLRLMADIAREMWEFTDFGMLYDASRELFSIGYNTAEGRLDASYYDLLASECRLASFLAIAKGDVAQTNWFRLGRTLAPAANSYALVSWSASMFEYLMPLLVMHAYPSTLLTDTYAVVVSRQEQYGRERGVPWGVSESAFNAKDAELTYQYQAFGVPGLGLKRGLSDDLVVAPYASALAMMVDLPAAIDNLRALAGHGAEGRFGYYESVDYTPGRVPAGAQRAVVKAYFAHHQGMAFAAADDVLTGSAMQRRFHEDPLVRSADLLLQERVPRHVPITRPHVDEVEYVRAHRELPPPVQRSYPTADTPTPATHFLSNGSYSVMVTNAGSGYSRYRDLSVTRYREDITRDPWGSFVYVRDVGSGRFWSIGYQPTLAEPDDYHVTFSADKAELRRRDGDIETYTEIAVSPEEDVEVRRITLTNHGRLPCNIELTSYFEVTIAPLNADQAHRAFSNLFVETEADPARRAVYFSRRPRSNEEQRLWGFHVLGCEPGEQCDFEVETDRARFVGRLRTPRSPRAMTESTPLSGTLGAVLDPVVAVRRTVAIAPGGSVRVAYATGMSPTREGAEALVDKYGDVRASQRALDLAWTSSQIELRDLGLTPDEAVVFQRLASRLLLTDPQSPLKLIPDEENRTPLSGLWQLGISGDLPILLLRIDRLEDTPLVRQLLLAHQYWRQQGLQVDLIIVNTRPSAYIEELDEKLRLLVRTGHALQLLDKPGGVFLRKRDQMQPDIWLLLCTVARVTLLGDRGSIVSQLNRRASYPELPDQLFPKKEPREWPSAPFVRPELLFDNGTGGFDPDTGEYVIVLEDDETTPAPWVNVMANPTFGSMVSEAGIGCTWALNSHENRLTTWNNDPVGDGSGEAVYLRDEETGELWSPTPLPMRAAAPYVIRHGFGVSTFLHESHGLASEMAYFVDPEDPVRVVRLRLTNTGGVRRVLSAVQFVEFSMGDSRSRSQQRVVTRYDAEERMLTAHNFYNIDFPGRVAFLTTNRDIDSYTGSRTEFLGRNGYPGAPAALRRQRLAGTTGRFNDPCGALLTRLTLEPGETTEVVWVLGEAATLEEAREIAERHRRGSQAAATLEATRASWADLLGTIQVDTPDPGLDLMLNGWLLYQTVSCRIWGRTAFYQSSGAFGFRDQLQDVLALLPVRPDMARDQILEASRHQFPEGDALHWWQPYSGRGVRTHCTDDRDWLPFVLSEYLSATGDTALLDERTPYVLGPELPAEQEDLYFTPQHTDEYHPVYDHALAALKASMRVGVGEHGIPRILGGDWNDGMNRVGYKGRGESVWLGWFLITTARKFADVADERGDTGSAADLREFAHGIAASIEEHGWDGAWYRRAYFDDGTPLGTRTATEARIDAIAQAWAIISGAGDPARAARALASVEEHLVRWEDGLIALLDPPFDHMAEDPGYIKGYVPGVRENGGQYTHAAVWVVLAYLLSGDGEEALDMLDLINPVNRTISPEGVDLYKVEPYALVADVYSAKPHVGRGGWTWYTGAAAWYYTVAIQHLLGLRTVVGPDGTRCLSVDPTIPKTWDGFDATYRLGDTVWRIRVDNPRGVNRGVERVTIDGADATDGLVPLVEDSEHHDVRVTMLGG
jgi:cellobiose phosphorylase